MISGPVLAEDVVQIYGTLNVDFERVDAWGAAFVGQWDTPYKTISGAVDPMYFTGITYTGALIGTPGFGVGPVTIGAPVTSADGRTFAAGTNASFERRQGNSAQYWSPAI